MYIIAFLSAAFTFSTITALVISVILVAYLFFIFGFVSGCFCHKYKQSVLESCKTEAGLSSPSSGGAHVSSSEQDTQDLEMLEMLHMVIYQQLVILALEHDNVCKN